MLFALAALLVAFSMAAASCSGADTQRLETPETMEAQEPLAGESVQEISIDLVGDVNFADGWAVDVADANEGQAQAAFSPEIFEHLTSADIFYANHEFTMASSGTPLNKYYTFCADPSRIIYWQQLGVDVVGLANNHAYDYGEEAFLENLSLLENNGIPYVGAGRDLAEAMAPVFFEFDGYTVAFVAADRSQKGNEPRAASAEEGVPGVLFCFDDERFLEAVAFAAEQADFVIAIPHWGTENSTVLEAEQVELAHKIIDAGASAVVGSHPHILQGMEFYDGKLIAYSLGNFWFNWETVPTLVLNITIVEGEPTLSIIPALQTEQQVITSDQIAAEVIAEMRQLSPGVEISDGGVVTPAP